MSRPLLVSGTSAGNPTANSMASELVAAIIGAAADGAWPRN